MRAHAHAIVDADLVFDVEMIAINGKKCPKRAGDL
jgi:hypothetical protein